MLLCDSFAATRQNLSKLLSSRRHAIAGPARRWVQAEAKRQTRLAESLDDALRFVFQPSATHAAIEALLSRPSSLLEAVRHLRLPAPRVWLEWCDDDRRAKSRELGILESNDAPEAKRVGVLVEQSDDTGQQFVARLCWHHGDVDIGDRDGLMGIPSICPLLIRFDLDQDVEQITEPGTWPVEGNMVARWHHDRGELLALARLDTMICTEPDFWSIDTMTAMLEQGYTADAIIDAARRDMSGEPLMVLSLLLLLQARGAVERAPVDRSRLNRQRRALKRSPLYDHIVTRLKIAPETKGLARARTAGDLVERAPTRLHIVRGHFVTRHRRTADGEPSIYWRRAHHRGIGTKPLRRTVIVG